MTFMGFWPSFALGFALIFAGASALLLVGSLVQSLGLSAPQVQPFAVGCAAASVLLVTVLVYFVERLP